MHDAGLSNSPSSARLFGVTDAQLSAELKKWTGASPALHPVGELLDRHWEAGFAYARLCTDDARSAGMLTTAAFTRLFGESLRQTGPSAAWRPHLLVTVRRIVAEWDTDRRREQLHPELRSEAGEGERLAARLLPPADRRLLSGAFQRLPQSARCVLWHSEVEAEPLEIPAGLLGLCEEDARIELERARERLREESLQLHRELAPEQECGRFARMLDVTYRRGGVDVDPDLREHLDRCRHCHQTAEQLSQFNAGLGLALAEAVLGWGARAYVESRAAQTEEAAAGTTAEHEAVPPPVIAGESFFAEGEASAPAAEAFPAGGGALAPVDGAFPAGSEAFVPAAGAFPAGSEAFVPAAGAFPAGSEAFAPVVGAYGAGGEAFAPVGEPFFTEGDAFGAAATPADGAPTAGDAAGVPGPRTGRRTHATPGGSRTASRRSAHKAARRPRPRRRNLTAAIMTVSGLIVLPLVLWSTLGNGDGTNPAADDRPSEAPGSDRGTSTSNPSWAGAEEAAKGTLRGRLHNLGSGLCVGIVGGKAVEGAETELTTCSSAPGQQWSYETDGLVRNGEDLGLCLDSHLGYSVRLAPCTGTTHPDTKNIRYDFTLQGTLVPRFNQELALTPAATDGSGALVLKTRDANEDQRWVVDTSKTELQMEVVNWDAETPAAPKPTPTPKQAKTPTPTPTATPSTPRPTPTPTSPYPGGATCSPYSYGCSWNGDYGQGGWPGYNGGYGYGYGGGGRR
ncbi:ricin-type beta-trefoil lectin domain protein [Streptomyces dysideae]|uniref:Hydrolase n=1 Tax=Streptomyces dysideae TaxID=909626 RepID=A0A101UWM7_9ACTN|nr:ricin-type beta-trefoil lectin domain protein [Streptomyces dysideae]KUO18226.1 hydrolase [Streptomyces dysideae]